MIFKIRNFPLMATAAACVLVVMGIYAINEYTNDKKVAPVQADLKVDGSYLFNGDKWTELRNKTLRLSADGNIYLDDILQQASQRISSGQDVEIKIGRKKIFTIQLPDGSTIVANAGSTVKFPGRFSDNERVIFINGEAYCKIVPKAGHPFIVNYPQGKVDVLGTEFNINTYKNETPSVAVVTGSVSMNNDGISRQLNKGEKGTFIKGRYDVDTFDVKETTSWQENKLVFQNASKKDVEDAFENFYGKKLSIDRAFPSGLGRINILRTEKEEDFIMQLPYEMETEVVNDVFHVE
jgi:hypothetical protein